MHNTEYAIWIPERYNHAPPFWQDGMLWCHRETYPLLYNNGGSSIWEEGREYYVSPEAVTGLAVDDTRNDAKFVEIRPFSAGREFDPAAWLAEGHANADKLPAGVVLPEPRDWVDEVWIKLIAAGNRAADNEEGALFHESGQVYDRAAADAEKAVIRTHCQPREVSNLIAASPDLLAACQAVAASSMRNEAYDLCVTAIAKATKP